MCRPKQQEEGTGKRQREGPVLYKELWSERYEIDQRAYFFLALTYMRACFYQVALFMCVLCVMMMSVGLLVHFFFMICSISFH